MLGPRFKKTQKQKKKLLKRSVCALRKRRLNSRMTKYHVQWFLLDALVCDWRDRSAFIERIFEIRRLLEMYFIIQIIKCLGLGRSYKMPRTFIIICI